MLLLQSLTIYVGTWITVNILVHRCGITELQNVRTQTVFLIVQDSALILHMGKLRLRDKDRLVQDLSAADRYVEPPWRENDSSSILSQSFHLHPNEHLS